MFQVKICGVTREEDVASIAAAGADAVGINLVPISPRCVTLERARRLAQTARQLRLKSVVVLMDASPVEIGNAVEKVQPDILQLHGAETPDRLPAMAVRMPVVKSLAWTGGDHERTLARRWLDECSSQLAFLVDAYAPLVGGGTGRVARWDLLWPRPEELAQVPLLLAGGLTADNVVDGILSTHCQGVDTASGVESEPGIKVNQLVERFVKAARSVLH